MMDKDIAYFHRRLTEERQRSAQAECPAVRKTHSTLAELYADRIGHLKADPASGAPEA